MTPEQLKSSILQYAIQGKLVEQRPEEGTGEELYQQMREEIKTLERQKRFKVKDDSAISEDEIPFDIPESWKWLRLGQILNIESGKGLTAKQMRPGEIPVFGGNGITGYHDESLIEKETVVIGRVGFYCGSVHITPKNAWITDNAFITTYPEESINREYLVYVLRHMNLGQNSNATAQPVVSGKKIYPILFPLPPLAEQKRIVAKIEKLLPLVDRYAVAYEKLEQFSAKFPEDMKKSILQYAIQGKLVEQRPEEGTGEELYQQIQAEKQKLIKQGKIKKEKPLPEIAENEIPFDIPESWKWVRFSEIMNAMSTGPFGSMLHKTDYIKKGIPLVNPANMVNGKIVPSDKMMVSEETLRRLSSYILHARMIVLGRRGEMGRCAVVTENEDGWLCGTGSFFMEPSVSLYVYYVASLFSSPYVKFYLGGESVGTTMSNLNHAILSKMPIPLPPLAEQKRIVAKIEELMPLCERLK